MKSSLILLAAAILLTSGAYHLIKLTYWLPSYLMATFDSFGLAQIEPSLYLLWGIVTFVVYAFLQGLYWLLGRNWV